MGIVSAIIFPIPGIRRKIVFLLSIALVVGFILADPGFWHRVEDIGGSVPEMHASSQGRILAWEAALSMSLDYPFGVREGNFKTYIGKYNPGIVGRDTHNTFLRCLAELGVQGPFVLLLLIGNVFRMLFRLKKDIEHLPNKGDFLWHIYALKIALIISLVSGILITHTYIEEFYWLLMFPVVLERSVENELDRASNNSTI